MDNLGKIHRANVGPHGEVFVTVIIPVWNGAVVIAKCLEALCAQTYPKDAFEIIVIDNGSSDDTTVIAKSFPGVRVITELRPGSYAARNAGLASARGEFVAFTDADCIPAPRWLEEAVIAAGQRSAALYGGRTVLFAEDHRNSAAAKYELAFSFLSSDWRENAKRGQCITANWFCRRSLLLELGGFDVSVKSGGDVKMSKQVRDAGGEIVYVHDMVVHHPVRSDLKSVLTKSRRTLGGKWQRANIQGSRVLWLFNEATKEGLRKVRRTVTSRGSSLHDKVGICSVVFCVWFASTVELMRLTLGGRPKRG